MPESKENPSELPSSSDSDLSETGEKLPKTSGSVINTTDARFETDVMIRSQLGLVLVDFWAEWCAPCRSLGPVLEHLADEFASQLTLVKANTEQNEVAAGKFGVQGIPAVFAVRNEKVVDRFEGALPEAAIREWILSQLSREHLEELRGRVEANPHDAEDPIRQAMAESPSDELKLLLLDCLVRQAKTEPANELLKELESRGFLEPEAETLKAKLRIACQTHVDVDEVLKASSKDPDNLPLQFDAANALVASQRYEEAFEICLTLVTKDRKNTGEQARELMVDAFRVLPEDSELISIYRRKLSMALY